MQLFRCGAIVSAACIVFGVAPRLSGQGAQPPTAGVDLAGYWNNVFHQDPGLGTGGGMLVDYGGIPVSEAGRLYALAFDPSRMTVRQQQCPGYVAPYFYFAPQSYRFWEERDPITQELIAIKMYGQTSEQTRTIWMDGRAHPPAYAPHSWAGFATGTWEGQTLTVSTTHLKRAWQRINGVPQSDQATLVEHFIRHGDRITYVSIVNDPVYLAEPWIRSLDFVHTVRDPNSWLYACDDAEQIAGRRDDYVPSYPFGQHPFLREYAEMGTSRYSARSEARRRRDRSSSRRRRARPMPMRSPRRALPRDRPVRASQWIRIHTTATSMCGPCRATSTC